MNIPGDLSVETQKKLCDYHVEHFKKLIELGNSDRSGARTVNLGECETYLKEWTAGSVALEVGLSGGSMKAPKQPDDNNLKGSAALLVQRLVGVAIAVGHDPENVWLVLALAADALERALLYAGGAMGAASQVSGQHASGEYATYKARLDRLLREALVDHEAIGAETDRVLQVKRSAPQ